MREQKDVILRGHKKTNLNLRHKHCSLAVAFVVILTKCNGLFHFKAFKEFRRIWHVRLGEA